jgi:hypothetical protein
MAFIPLDLKADPERNDYLIEVGIFNNLFTFAES